MASPDLFDVMKRADALPLDERLLLIAHLAEQAAAAVDPERRYSWLDLEGAAPFPLLGEDAQQWVSRTRREADERRMRPWEERR